MYTFRDSHDEFYNKAYELYKKKKYSEALEHAEKAATLSRMLMKHGAQSLGVEEMADVVETRAEQLVKLIQAKINQETQKKSTERCWWKFWSK